MNADVFLMRRDRRDTISFAVALWLVERYAAFTMATGSAAIMMRAGVAEAR